MLFFTLVGAVRYFLPTTGDRWDCQNSERQNFMAEQKLVTNQNEIQVFQKTERHVYEYRNIEKYFIFIYHCLSYYSILIACMLQM
jgi:hypothetical protein